MPVPLPVPDLAQPRAPGAYDAARAPRARRARLPDIFPAPGALRPAVAVSAEISADGERGEFDSSRGQVLRWLEAHVGPLPGSFDRGIQVANRSCHVGRHRTAGAIVRSVDRKAGSRRYFGVSIEAGAVSGLAAWKAVVVLFRSETTSHLRAMLLAPRRRLQQRTAALWVPGIVHWLARSPGITDYGWRLVPEPWIVRDEEGVEGLIQLIGSRDRTRPVFATGLFAHETDPESAPLDPWDLAHRTAGIAHVAVLTGPMTYLLTDRVGRKYSVFGNALRTYRPGCVIGSGAMEHPMALPDTVQRWRNGGPHEFAVFLTREAARASVVHAQPGASWFPESLAGEMATLEGNAPGSDPFGNALLRPAEDGDALHPLGAGDDSTEREAAEQEEAPVPAVRAG